MMAKLRAVTPAECLAAEHDLVVSKKHKLQIEENCIQLTAESNTRESALKIKLLEAQLRNEKLKRKILNFRAAEMSEEIDFIALERKLRIKKLKMEIEVLTKQTPEK